MAKVISFINMKGGVGKTTLCKEVGFHLAKKRGLKVLFIDIDPQINLTQSVFKAYGYRQKKQIEVDNEGNLEDSKLVESMASIEEILSHSLVRGPDIDRCIQNLDDFLSIIPGELGLEFSLRNLNSGTLENGIYNFIEKNSLRDEFDFILIDCPPTYSSYTVAALLPSDYYLVPVKPEGYSILGIDMLLKVIDLVVSEKNMYFRDKPLNNLGVIFTNIERTPRTGIISTLESIKESEILKSKNLYYFNEYFLHNPQIPKEIEYFIDSSNSHNSKMNLEVLVDEIIGRIDTYESNN